MSKWYNPTGDSMWDDWYKFWTIFFGIFFGLGFGGYLVVLMHYWYTAPCQELRKEMSSFYAPARCISPEAKS